MFCAECRVDAAIGGAAERAADSLAAHCNTCMPPIEPPATANSESMPR